MRKLWLREAKKLAWGCRPSKWTQGRHLSVRALHLCFHYERNWAFCMFLRICIYFSVKCILESLHIFQITKHFCS